MRAKEKPQGKKVKIHSFLENIEDDRAQIAINISLGVVVSTPDSESGDRGSNPCERIF